MFPKSIKIGGLIYSVDTVEHLDQLEVREGLIGHIDFVNCSIRLEKNSCIQMQNQTLIHEITHGIYEEAGLEQTEETVNKLAKVVYQVLIDNDFSFLRPDEAKEEVVFYGSELIKKV